MPPSCRAHLLIALLPAVALAACTTPRTGNPPGENFRLDAVAKADLDMVAEVHRREAFAALRQLMEKLYRRNPAEWRKTDSAGIDGILSRTFDVRHNWRFPEHRGKVGVDALQLAFQDDFSGDRVLAFIGGLGHMLHTSYNEKSNFYLLDDLDPQRLYNSARNVEIAVWRLSNRRTASGEPYLLSNEVANLSFERAFGRLIAQQDTLALIVAGKSNRTLAKVAQNLATAVFLPVGAALAR